MSLRKAFFVLLLLASPRVFASAQTAPSKAADDSLFNTISALDAKFFDAYNKCELERFGSFLAEDMEFYHDQGGLFRTRQTVVDSVKNNICGKIERELVPGTLEVYPLRGYGAVEIGVHRFRRPGSKDTVSEAKFIQIWENKNGNWQVTRVISFDHQDGAK